MLFQTPKDKTIIWIVALLLFFLIPITFYLTEKVMLETSDVQFEGSAIRVLIGWFVLMFLVSPFIYILMSLALKNYQPNAPFIIFNFNRILWSCFWIFLFTFWLLLEIFTFLQFFRHLYFPEAMQVITFSLLFYLQLCLLICIIQKKSKFGSDFTMICIASSLTAIAGLFMGF